MRIGRSVRNFKRWMGIILLGVALPSAAVSDAAAAQKTALPTANEIITTLQDEIDWYQQVSALTETPVGVDEMLYSDGVHTSAGLAVRLGFDLARAEAQLLLMSGSNGSAQPSGSKAPNLIKLMAAATQRIADIQAALIAIDQQAAHSTTQPATTQPSTLAARRSKLVAELNLAMTRRDVIANFSSFMNAPTSGGLQDKIDELEQTIPDLPPEPTFSTDTGTPVATGGAGGAPAVNASAAGASPTAAQSAKGPVLPGAIGMLAAAASAASAPSAQSAATPPPPVEQPGIFGLVSELFTIAERMSQISHLQGQAVDRRIAADTERKEVVAELQSAMHRYDVLANGADTDNVAKINADREQIDELGQQYRLLVSEALPLSEQNTELTATIDQLELWHGALGPKYVKTLMSLLERLGAVMGAILLVLLMSKLWRRATFRYVTEPRRRRVFLLVRRVVTGTLISLIILMAFVTEFGSLATFVGIITAGIAVALQSIILAGVAYFFVIGRYGIRIGDRVSVNGITGDVVDTGLFRFYLMELGGTGWDLHPTGRIVVFSNAVLFQASAFYKQMPGTEYTWHEVSMTLSPESDYKLAQDLLLGAVESVYNGYKDRILAQHESASSQVHLPMLEPRPQGRLRFVDAGLEFLVRYPVEISNASEVDDQVTRALLEKIQSEPKLKLVVSGTPRIQRAA